MIQVRVHGASCEIGLADDAGQECVRVSRPKALRKTDKEVLERREDHRTGRKAVESPVPLFIVVSDPGAELMLFM